MIFRRERDRTKQKQNGLRKSRVIVACSSTLLATFSLISTPAKTPPPSGASSSQRAPSSSQHPTVLLLPGGWLLLLLTG